MPAVQINVLAVVDDHKQAAGVLGADKNVTCTAL